MVLMHSDIVARRGMHSTEVGSFMDGERPRPIMMLSDMSCGVHGLWSASQDVEHFRLIFQGKLEASVRRFARGHTRSPWQLATRRLQYGYLESARDAPDVLGVSLDGSLRHFALLRQEAWQFLRFVQNLAAASPAVCPHTCPRPAHGDGVSFDPEPRSDPKSGMHVDGDVLQRCLDARVLEDVLASEPRHAPRFRQLLRALVTLEHGDVGTEGLGDEDEDEDGEGADGGGAEGGAEGEGGKAKEKDFRLAYNILEYYLAPVL